MVTPTYIANCTAIKKLTADVFEVKFKKPVGFTFQPGQFVLLHIPLVDDAANIQTRAYSIAAKNGEQELLFVIKIFPQGRMSQYIRDVLKVGTALPMQGPFGRFILKDDSDSRLLFLATGAGIAPFRSQILTALEVGDVRTMDLVFGFRSEDDQFWIPEFQTIADRYSNIRLHIALTKPSDYWRGLTGRVQEIAKTLVTDPETTLLYACGHPEMTVEVKKRAVEDWGLPKANVHVEGYI